MPNCPALAQRRGELLERFRATATEAVLGGYREHLEACATPWVQAGQLQPLLDLFLLERAAYEVEYEGGQSRGMDRPARQRPRQGWWASCWRTTRRPDEPHRRQHRRAMTAARSRRRAARALLLPPAIAILLGAPLRRRRGRRGRRGDPGPAGRRLGGTCRRRGKELAPMEVLHAGGIFAARLGARAPGYRLRIGWRDGSEQCSADPYAFGLLLGEMDLYLIAEGRHLELGSCLGAQWRRVDGVQGVRFAVWAPNAQRVSVIGDFNGWLAARHPMRLRHPSGVWGLFVPAEMGARPGCRYKFDLLDPAGHALPDKADPVALATEAPPATASVIAAPGLGAPPFAGTTRTGCSGAPRPTATPPHVRLRSPRRFPAGSRQRPGFRLADARAAAGPIVAELGFTHIEFLPVMEHPFGGSWGYQPLSLYAPTARLGPPQAFAAFIDRCHQAGIGVILDWVPAHFPTDPHGLGRFDGTALYEHRDHARACTGTGTR